MTREEALLRLGDSTVDAVADVLRQICGDVVDRGPVSVVSEGAHPLHPLPVPAIAASVSYVDGVTGGNVFVMNAPGARKLAAAMSGAALPEEDSGAELSELELSAIAEAANQMFAATAAATGAVLGEEVQIAPPQTRIFATATAADNAYDETPHATSVSLTLHGEPCRLVQLVPNAFVVRMTRAFADLEAELASDGLAGEAGAGSFPVEELQQVQLRLAVEAGRARLPLGRAVGLTAGAVLQLDQAADAPLELLVNGRRFGTGRLLQRDAQLALRVEQIFDPTPVRTYQPEKEV